MRDLLVSAINGESFRCRLNAFTSCRTFIPPYLAETNHENDDEREKTIINRGRHILIHMAIVSTWSQLGRR